VNGFPIAQQDNPQPASLSLRNSAPAADAAVKLDLLIFWPPANTKNPVIADIYPVRAQAGSLKVFRYFHD
jgi:hypothetical protein